MLWKHKKYLPTKGSKTLHSQTQLCLLAGMAAPSDIRSFFRTHFPKAETQSSLENKPGNRKRGPLPRDLGILLALLTDEFS
jgi:hypothetical protein